MLRGVLRSMKEASWYVGCMEDAIVSTAVGVTVDDCGRHPRVASGRDCDRCDRRLALHRNRCGRRAVSLLARTHARRCTLESTRRTAPLQGLRTKGRASQH